MFNHKIVRLGLACLALSLAATSGAFAGSATNNVTVSATISNNCVLSTGTVAFGSYDPVVTNNTAPLNQTGTFTVSCTKGAAATIALGNGANFNGGHRFMASGGNKLQYELYSDSGMTHVWNSGNMVSYNSTTMAATTETIYGQIAAGQDVNTGSYSDTVVATVNF